MTLYSFIFKSLVRRLLQSLTLRRAETEELKLNKQIVMICHTIKKEQLCNLSLSLRKVWATLGEPWSCSECIWQHNRAQHVKQRRVPHTHKQSQELNSEEATGYDRSKVVIWDKKRLSFNRKSYSPSTFYLWVTPVAMKTSRMDIDTWGIFTCQYSLRSRAGKRSHTVHPVWKKSL